MKLAEALLIRGDLQKQIDQMDRRLKAASRVQEGDEPIENIEDVFKELHKCLTQFEKIVTKINKTNQSTVLPDGMTITAKIAHRDRLKMHCKITQSLLSHVTDTYNRFSRSEIKYVNLVDVPELREKANALSRELRKTDMELQEANWTVDLCD